MENLIGSEKQIKWAEDIREDLKKEFSSENLSNQEMEYFWQRRYVGIGEEIKDQMYHRLMYKQVELEHVATETDLD